MLTENSFSRRAEIESAHMSSTEQQMLNNLKSSKEYRHAFIEEAIRTRLTAQIEAIRTERGWDYKRFAEEIKKKVSWTYRLEDPNATVPTIPTLLEVAEAFDVGLDVRFRSFSELLDDVASLQDACFNVPSFEAESKAGVFVKSHRRTKKAPRYGRRPLRMKTAQRTKHTRMHAAIVRAPIDSSSQTALALAS
jgi:transcriptional regulator with XRE-family HTH domain